MASFNYKFADLVDIPALEKIMADLYEAARIPSAIIDLEGNLLTGAGWQRICLDFHRKNPETEKACIKSDTYTRDELQAGEPYAIYECPHGLVDSCCPVIVDGHHLANVFAGQMLHTPPDDEIRDRFRGQARKFGFNEEEYLKALSEVPVYPIDKHKSILEFLSNFAGQIAQMGLTKLKSLEKVKVIQESEEKLRALIETTDTGYVIIDQQGLVLDANREYVRIAGYQQLVEIMGRNVLEWTAEYDLERNKEEVGKCFREGQVRNLELDYVHPDGSTVPIEINATVIKQGGQTSVLTMVRDITERRQSAESLQASEARYRSLFNNKHTVMLLIDPDTAAIVEANPAACSFYGYKREELIRMAISDINTLSLEEAKREMAKVKKEQRQHFIFQHRLADGTIRDVEVYREPIQVNGRQLLYSIIHDITARKQVEESLIKSESQLSESQIVAKLGSWDLNLVSQELEWSKQTYRLFDQDPEKVTPSFDEFARLVHPDDFANMQTNFNNALESDATPYHVKIRIINDSGREWVMEAFGKVRRDSNGKATSMFGTAQDITERLRVEEALAQANEEWHYAMDFLEDAIYLVDMDDKLVRANKTFYQMTGLTSEQAVGQDITSIIHPQGEEVPCPVCAARIARKDAVINMEPDHPDNPTSRPIEVMVKMIRDSAEKPIGVLMGIRDLSRQREVETLLRQGKEEWETTFDAMSDIITIQDKDMRIIRANKAAHDFFEVKTGALNGRYCYEIFRGEDKPCAQCPELETIADYRAHSGTIKHEKLGKIFTVSSSPVFEENGEIKYLVHVAKDITEQKKLEEDLFQSHKMEAIGTLAGGIAHDFNNILSAIIGYSELTLIDLPENSSSRDNVNQIYKAGARATELVKQILSFSRKDKQKLEPFEPSSIIKEALKLMRASLPASIAIKEEIAPNCGKILADPTNLHQILVNLCTNALHAIENEKGEILIKLGQGQLTSEDIGGQISVEPGVFVVLTVSDTGCGMDKTTVDRIFEPYFTTKDPGKGTGMGLSVVHGIMQSYGGMIKVVSEQGQGATFSLYFPAIENGIAGNVEKKAGFPESLPRGNERILAIDDEVAILKMLQIFLENLGYIVTTKVSSVEALEEFRKNPGNFDLIITDQTMPVLTGVDLAKEIAEIKPDLPIILCTGYSSVISEEEAKEVGIQRFAKKPVDVKDLAAMVRQVLDNN
ncbi:MAG: PAS domain S-box protein [Thermodesulfobacteriota bacterium]